MYFVLHIFNPLYSSVKILALYLICLCLAAPNSDLRAGGMGKRYTPREKEQLGPFSMIHTPDETEHEKVIPLMQILGA